MPGCSVYGCGNYSRKTKGTDVRYYRFPQNENLSKQWTTACHRSDQFKIKTACVCSKHFSSSAFTRSLRHEMLNYAPKNCRDIKPEAVPTEFLPYQKCYLKSTCINRNKKIQGSIQFEETRDGSELVLGKAEDSHKLCNASSYSENKNDDLISTKKNYLTL